MRIQCVTGVYYAPKNHNIHNNQTNICQNKVSHPTFGFWYPAMEKQSSQMSLKCIDNIIEKRKIAEKLFKQPPAHIQKALANVSADFKPKNGIWLKEIEGLEINTSKLEKYTRKYLNVKGSSEKILRTISSTKYGETVYMQDEYPNGKLVTYVITRAKDGTKTTKIIQ